MMAGCSKCLHIAGITFLVLGILYLGQDLAWWSFWTISWWTALFVFMGVGHLASAKCPDCTAVRTGKKK